MNKARLGKVGDAAIRARMSDADVTADPAKAFHIAQTAMRATLQCHRSRDDER